MVMRCSLPVALSSRADVQDAVAIDIEGDFDLGLATRPGSNAFQTESAQEHVVRGDRPFPLVDFDVDRRLIVLRRGEDLGLARGNGGIARDEHGHHPT